MTRKLVILRWVAGLILMIVCGCAKIDWNPDIDGGVGDQTTATGGATLGIGGDTSTGGATAADGICSTTTTERPLRQQLSEASDTVARYSATAPFSAGEC